MPMILLITFSFRSTNHIYIYIYDMISNGLGLGSEVGFHRFEFENVSLL